MRDDSLLLDLGVPFRIIDGEVCVEAMAHSGLHRWLDHFESLTVCAPVMPGPPADRTMAWVPGRDLAQSGRLRLLPLPWGYDPASHLRSIHRVRRQIREQVPRHRYLCVSNLGWLGAWGSIVAETAHAMDRPYAAWVGEVYRARSAHPAADPLRAAWQYLQHTMASRRSLRDIRRARLGLLHGRTVYDAYAGLPASAELVHDVHLEEADLISVPALERRLAEGSRTLHLVYAGSVEDRHGPQAWLQTLQHLLARWPHARPLQATWIGDGPLLQRMRQEARSAGLEGRVAFPGPEPDRGRLMERLRQADAFVFCHTTPESPWCLIEALMSGLPLLGFAGARAAELLQGAEGGACVPTGDAAGLAQLLLDRLARPAVLRQMSLAARAAGAHYTDVSVFRQRSELIKARL